MEHWISFPGLGIDAFRLDAVAFTIFGREVRWYGIIVTVGILAAFVYTAWRAGKSVAGQSGIAFDDVLDATLLVVPGGIIGARLYFIAFEYFGEHRHFDSFLDAIAFWDGGLAIYGGIIAGALIVLAVTAYKKIRPLRFFDALAPGVMLGQVIGRWGNFTNGEAHGGETNIFCRMGLSPTSTITKYYHPTFLYESLWNLVGFILINIFYKKKKFDGQWLLTYLAWYGFGRGFIELLRTDSLCIPGTAIRISSVLGFVTCAISLVLLILFSVRTPRALSPALPTYGERKKKGASAAAPVKKVVVVPEKAAHHDSETGANPASARTAPASPSPADGAPADPGSHGNSGNAGNPEKPENPGSADISGK